DGMSTTLAKFSAWRERVAAAHVLVVGDVMLDRYWFGDVERISPEAPVAVAKIARTEERPGGAGNVARNIAALGASATLLSVIGDLKGDDWAKYRAANLLTPNLGELRQVIGRWHDEQELARKAQWLRSELAVDALLVTRSEEGMTLFSAEGVVSIPAQAREVYD